MMGDKVNCLFEAIESKNVTRVREILSKNPELCSYEKVEYSPMWQAALSGCKKIVEALIKADQKTKADQKNVDKKSKYHGFTLIQYFANVDYSFSKSKVAEVLVKHGADINAYNGKITTPLRMSVENGNTQYAKFLLKNGARLEGSEWNRKSPASYAFFCIEDDAICKEMLLLMLDHGLDTSFHNGDGENLLHTLIGYQEPSSRNGDIVKIVEILLDAGVPINDIDTSGYSPLLCALNLDKVKLATFLIRRGADVKMKGNSMLPLSSAVYIENKNLITLIDLIIKNGAEINDRNEFDETALHVACYVHDEKLISLLIRKGAEISPESRFSSTPFSELIPERDKYEPCSIAMVKEFSKLSFENIPIFEKDMHQIRKIPKAQKNFEKRADELKQLASTKFYASYSYYSLLRMSKNIKKLALLTKNDDFVTNFQTNLDKFIYYKQDLQRILEEASQYRDRLDCIQFRLYLIFKEIFPDIIIRKLADNLSLEDLPL